MSMDTKELKNGIVREVDAFLTGFDQMKVGFSSRLQNLLDKTFKELDDNIVHIQNLEKEITILRENLKSKES